MSDTITVTGNIATEPERKHTSAGAPLTTFRVASTQRRYDRAAERWIDGSTNWYSVSAFRALGEHAYRSLHKGERVILTGRLRLREWETSSKRGVTAEIDAEAIGHDLLWGTSTYRRTDAGVPAHAAAATTWEPSGDEPDGSEPAPMAPGNPEPRQGDHHDPSGE